MKHDAHERRIVAKEKILFPVDGPRQIKKHCSHFECKYDQQCAIKPVHGSAKFRPVGSGSGSTNGLLKGGDALGHVTVVDVHRSEEHTSELQSHSDLVCRLLLEKNK